MTGCVSNQNKTHQLRVNGEHQSIEQKVALENARIVHQHDPRHVDVFVKDFGLEQGNSVQTSATHDVTERRAGVDGPSSTQQIQVARCKMFVPQSRASRYNVHWERVLSKAVKPTHLSLDKLKRPGK